MADCPHEKMFEHRLRKAIKIAMAMKDCNIRDIAHLDSLPIKDGRHSILKVAQFESASDATWNIVDQLLNIVRSFNAH
jgi:hypothetical protein